LLINYIPNKKSQNQHRFYMKVLLATHSYGLNGAALLLRDLAEHWIKHRGWEIEALMSKEELELNGDALVAIGIAPITTTTGQPNEYNVALVNTLLDIPLVETLRLSMPVILWVHEGNTLLFNWDIELSKLVRGFMHCSSIVFQTKWQSEKVFKSFIEHLPSERIHYVPSGVKTQEVIHKTTHAVNGPIKIITLGTVYGRKRQMDLIKAVDVLAEKYPIECYVVGDYSQATDWLPRIQDDLQKSNPSVKWLGAIKERTIINELLLNADIACFPSGDESHPLALLEAGLCALPMVISSLPPYGHIGWVNGKNCLMYPVGDIAQFIFQIERLIQEEGLRVRLGKNARNMVLSKYSKSKFYENMDKVIAPFEKIYDRM